MRGPQTTALSCTSHSQKERERECVCVFEAQWNRRGLCNLVSQWHTGASRQAQVSGTHHEVVLGRDIGREKREPDPPLRPPPAPVSAFPPFFSKPLRLLITASSFFSLLQIFFLIGGQNSLLWRSVSSIWGSLPVCVCVCWGRGAVFVCLCFREHRG